MENIENTAVEPEVNTNEVETEVTNPVPEVVEEKEVFKPWLKKQEEPKEQVIPYSRFKEINDEKKAYQSKVEEYEAKLAEYEKKNKKLEAITDPDQLDPENYTDFKEYLKARDEVVLNQVEKRTIERQQREVFEAKQAEVVNNYVKNVSESIAKNPEIKDAVEFVSNLEASGKINPHIISEIMLDENAAELIYDIATNQELLEEMLGGNPTDFIRKMHKMSARIDKATRYATNQQANTPVKQSEPVVALTKNYPTKIKAEVAGKIDLDKASLSDYRAAYRARGKR